MKTVGDPYFYNPIIARHQESIICCTLAILTGLGVALGYIFHQQKSYDFVGVWLPGSIATAGLLGVLYNSSLLFQTYKRQKEAAEPKIEPIPNEPPKPVIVPEQSEPPQLVIPSKSKETNQSIRLHKDENARTYLLDFLEFRDALHWAASSKGEYRRDRSWAALSFKLGREGNDQLQPRDYIQRFAIVIQPLRQYFPKKSILAFGPKSTTTSLIIVSKTIPRNVDQIGVEMLAKFLLRWANKTAEKEVSRTTANSRQLHLKWGSEKGYIFFMKLMLNHHAQIDMGDSNLSEGNPLTRAARFNQMASVQFLLLNGAQINFNYNGYSALATAVNGNQMAMVEFFIQQGADIQTQAFNGHKPIHYARNVDCMTLLVKAGANLMDKNNKGETALDVYWNNNLRDVYNAAMALVPKQS